MHTILKFSFYLKYLKVGIFKYGSWLIITRLWTEYPVFQKPKSIWQGLSIKENICAKASRKIWRFAGSMKYFFKKYHEKAFIQSFPVMYIKGGQHLFKVSQNEDFLQKNAFKTAFSEDTKKCKKKTHFLLSGKLLEIWYMFIYPGYHHVKAYVLRIPKMYNLSIWGAY